ncbi:zinc finger protein 64 homolog, isoforms 1 and 2-like [Diaphorina citri]|uniref:Zinc finger protein 64 homolog, isoforms 1 and 2-like n=1 Tax=Diaphorina citri TaxID=121845 RepID=A0A1S3DB47_DIACI|nr:zinc finger protein 64 homolog, isoforms 1 and 2-like [Diaphorina citri]
MPRPNPVLYKYVCYACSFHTYKACNIRRHVCIHLDVKPFKCPVYRLCIHCETFLPFDIEELVNHCRTCVSMSRLDGFRYKFVCFACSSFHSYNSTGIRRHINIHLGEKPFAYQICLHCRSFQSSNINDWVQHCQSCEYMPRPHEFRHKYVCFACAYFTYKVGNIKRHLNIHLGEKPYMCNQCDYSCRDTQSLKLHMKKYHNSD